MKRIVTILICVTLSKVSSAQIEIFKLKKQPFRFYESLNEKDAIVSDSTADLVGNDEMLRGMTLSFTLYKDQKKVYSDTTFSIQTDITLDNKFREYAKNAPLPIGTPILFRIKGKAIFVAFVWNTVSSFGCDCIAVFPNEKEQTTDLVLGLGTKSSIKRPFYYSKILSLYNYIKFKR
jgi:hypothetical protein